MPKHKKTHKGLQKRIKISAGGKVLFKHARSGHLKSKRSGQARMGLRRKGVSKAGDVRRLEKILNRHLLRKPDAAVVETTSVAATPVETVAAK